MGLVLAGNKVGNIVTNSAKIYNAWALKRMYAVHRSIG